MRAYLVEGVAKLLEDALLTAEITGSGFGSLRLECSMHPFVSPILLGIARSNALMCDPELKPPDIEPS